MKLLMTDRPVSAALPQDAAAVDLSALRIANCVGCFGCWTKTPGRCIIRDDAVRVYPLIARSEQVLYVSRVKYGSYAPVMKTMLERAIPVQQAFLRIHNGETHHVQRAVVPKDAVILAYGADRAEERALFTRLVERNAHNMSFRSHRVRFVAEGELEAAVGEEVTRW